MSETVIEGLAAWELDALAEINDLERQAYVAEDEPSGIRWVQAERVAKARDAGMSERKIAAGWMNPDTREPYSKSHVHYTLATWDVHGHLSDQLRFNTAYNSDEVRGTTSAHVGHNSGENEWYTPPELIAAAEQVMGGIDLDPASTPVANKMIGAARIYTKEDNGLEQEWKGRVWLNPPYAQPLIEHFADKLIIEYAKDNVTAACVLVNNATDTYWFQHLADVSNALCFTRGRVRFWHPDRVSAPLQGQAIIYFGDNTVGFLSTFDAFGFVMRHG